MMDGHTSFLAAFAFWSLPYCTSKSGGDHFGDSGGGAGLSSRLFQLPHFEMGKFKNIGEQNTRDRTRDHVTPYSTGVRLLISCIYSNVQG